MTHMKQLNRSLLALALGAMASYAWAQAQESKPIVKSRFQQVQATVTNINYETREVTLQGEKGPLTVQVSPDVKNLERVRAGDKVTVSYYQGLAAQLAKPGSRKSSGDASAFATPAKIAGGTVGASVTSTVTVEDIDLPTNTVAFRRPDGSVHIASVRSADGQKFLRTLKPGDNVDVTYTESVAVNVIPSGGTQPVNR
jgi:hypothetical protein